ncbi:hypothetical protein [Actinomadura sp. GTD37]|uniref:hypothetical protein n=1 Tax=Actinomadura sp. GTD37 TaxID=1778030 RepID=UPI0035BED185
MFALTQQNVNRRTARGGAVHQSSLQAADGESGEDGRGARASETAPRTWDDPGTEGGPDALAARPRAGPPRAVAPRRP